MSTVTCTNCNAQNTEGSKFCNNCGVALPLSSHITCPNCAVRNPRNLMYCDNCGTRLLPTGELSSEREEDKESKGESREAPRAFSLPARDPGDELDQNQLLDWLRTGEDQQEEGATEQAGDSQETVLGDWLSELSDEVDLGESEVSEQTESVESGEFPSQDDSAVADLTDWLSDVENSGSDDAGIDDWLAELEESPEEETADIVNSLPDWLDELEDDIPAETQQTEVKEETVGDWFTDFEASDGEHTADLESDLADTDELTPFDPTPDDFLETLKAPSPFSESNESFADWLEDSENKEESEPTEVDEELADWLSGIDTDDEMPTLIDSSPEREEEELPDWLSDIESDEETTTPTDEDEALPDWLSGIDSEEETPSLVEPTSEEDGELPEWLSGIDTDEALTPPTDEAEELPDWLSGIDSEEETPTPVEPIPEEDADELSDWLSDLDSDEETTIVGSTIEEDGDELPDWLSDIDSDEEIPSRLETTESMGEEETLTDWLGELDIEDNDQPTEAASLDSAEEAIIPDWLSDFADDDEESDLPLDLLDETEEAEALPDWLDDFETFDSQLDDQETAVQTENADGETDYGEFDDLLIAGLDLTIAPAEQGTSEDDITTDWLSEMPDEETRFSPLADEQQDETADIFPGFGTVDFATVDEPDWLSEISPTSSDLEEEAEGEVEESLQDVVETDEDDDLPDWLSDFSAEGEEVDLDEDTDWFAALSQEEPWPEVAEDEAIAAQLEESEETATETTSPSQELKGVPKELASSGLPDWLQEDMPNNAPEVSFFEDEGVPLAEGDLPDWLQEMKPADLTASEQGETQDDWQTIFENMPPSQHEMGESAVGLSSAEIPAWLQALKPRAGGEVEEIVESDEPPETEGPLAGLRGVLPVAPTIAEPTAAATAAQYTISKDQQQQISLLHQLTHEEPAKTKQIARKKATTFSGLWRAILGILLLAAILAGIIIPRTDIGLPETALPVSQSALDTFETVDPIIGRSVLVAFDYTPSMAAELDPIALMLLRQLAANGNQVMTISQSAAGTAIADQLVSEVSDLESQSLGLLTGEAVGLRSLGSCLNTVDSCEPLFDQLTDTAVQSDLADLGLVIILTSDRNSLINWVEQVESQTEVPVISAVAQPLGPLTIPYLSSGQLEGSLNGIPAASAYEKRLLGQDGSAFQQFAAQTIVMWVVIVTLIVAALFYGLTGLSSRDEKQGNG